MKSFLLLAVAGAIGVAVALDVVPLRHGTPPPTAEAEVATVWPRTYRVFALGAETACSLAVMEAGSIETQGSCADALRVPEGTDLNWTESDSGFLLSSSEAGTRIAFAVSDGVAYEAVDPPSLMVSLVAMR